MNDHDLLATLERSARSVSRLSTATKIICGLMLFIAAILMLYAFSRAGRNTEDFVGLGLIALAVTAFAFLFWSIAAFHAAFGESLKVVAAVHYNIDQLVRLQQKKPSRAAPSTQALLARGDGLPSIAALAAQPPADQDAPAKPTEAAAATAEPAEPQEPEPTTKSCRNCGGEIHIEATRCRHCLKHV